MDEQKVIDVETVEHVEEAKDEAKAFTKLWKKTL